MKKNFTDDDYNLLFNVILSLKDEQECKAFLMDLCTEAEINSMTQRFIVAKMLHENKKYDEIEASTGAAPAIISRVKRCMKNYEKYGILDR